jgi:hypothetical protein
MVVRLQNELWKAKLLCNGQRVQHDLRLQLFIFDGVQNKSRKPSKSMFQLSDLR